MRKDEVIWAFGILLSVLGFPLAIHLSGGKLYDPAQYNGLIPSFNFIAFSIVIACVIETIDLAFSADKNKIKEEEHRNLVIYSMGIILLSILYFATFVSNIIEGKRDGYKATTESILFALALIVIATIASAAIKRAARAVQ